MEKEKVNYLAIILAVCVVLTGILCFYLGTYFGEKGVVEKEKTTETNKDNKEDKGSMTDEEVDKLGKDLFGKINFTDGITYGGGFYFIDYNNKEKYNQSDLSDNDKFSAAMDSLIVSDYDITEEIEQNPKCGPENQEKECIFAEIKKEEFTEELIALFGTDVRFNYDNYYDNPVNGAYIAGWKFEGEKLIGYLNNQGGYGTGEAECNVGYKLKNTVLDNNSVILTVEPYAYACSPDIDMTEYEKEIAETRKITFKQDSTKNWYWVSTELIK